MTKDKPPCPFPGDELEKQFPWETTSPEEYAARNAPDMFSLDRFSYKNAKFEEWMVRFGSIVRSVEKLEECRKKHLTPEEQVAHDQLVDDIINGKVDY
jgi:hypothetical protein